MYHNRIHTKKCCVSPYLFLKNNPIPFLWKGNLLSFYCLLSLSFFHRNCSKFHVLFSPSYPPFSKNVPKNFSSFSYDSNIISHSKSHNEFRCKMNSGKVILLFLILSIPLYKKIRQKVLVTSGIFMLPRA